MSSPIGIVGFAEATVYRPDGTIKQHEYKENHFTKAALLSMFSSFLFITQSTDSATVTADARRSILCGQGSTASDTTYPVHSYRAPEYYGVYCMDIPVEVNEETQFPPYIEHDAATLSPHVTFCNRGKSASAFYTTESTGDEKLQRSAIDCSFSLVDNSFTTALSKMASAGSGTVRSVIWGTADVLFTQNYGMNHFSFRHRILTNVAFNQAGRNPMYSVEQRLIDDVAHTILWQDNRYITTGSWSDSDVSSIGTIYGFDLTAQTLLPKTSDPEDTTVESYTIMTKNALNRARNGIIIRNTVFSVSKGTRSSNQDSIVISRSKNWKETLDSTTYPVESITIRFTLSSAAASTFSGNGEVFPVLAHNLADTDSTDYPDGTIELYYTNDYVTNTSNQENAQDNTKNYFQVIRIKFNPNAEQWTAAGAVLGTWKNTATNILDVATITNTTVAETSGSTTTLVPHRSYQSQYCISNYDLSSAASSTAGNSLSYPRSQFVPGFIDYYTRQEVLQFYLPYTQYTHYVVSRTRSMIDSSYTTLHNNRIWTCRTKMGAVGTFDNESNQFVISRVHVINPSVAGTGDMNQVPTIGASDAASGWTAESDATANYRCICVNRLQLWAYQLPVGSETPKPVQFMPMTGNNTNTASFSLGIHSMVMCGLSFDNDVVKTADDALVIKYGWRIGQMETTSMITSG
jgi:hypothetical protein